MVDLNALRLAVFQTQKAYLQARNDLDQANLDNQIETLNTTIQQNLAQSQVVA